MGDAEGCCSEYRDHLLDFMTSSDTGDWKKKAASERPLFNQICHIDGASGFWRGPQSANAQCAVVFHHLTQPPNHVELLPKGPAVGGFMIEEQR